MKGSGRRLYFRWGSVTGDDGVVAHFHWESSMKGSSSPLGRGLSLLRLPWWLLVGSDPLPGLGGSRG